METDEHVGRSTPPSGHSTPATFRRFERMSRREDFSRVRREGRRHVGRILFVWTRSRGERPPRASRLGLSVGRHLGSAVQRNLFKRRVREAFRCHKSDLPRGWDILVAPVKKPGKPFPPRYAEMEKDFMSLVSPR